MACLLELGLLLLSKSLISLLVRLREAEQRRKKKRNASQQDGQSAFAAQRDQNASMSIILLAGVSLVIVVSHQLNSKNWHWRPGHQLAPASGLRFEKLYGA